MNQEVSKMGSRNFGNSLQFFRGKKLEICNTW